MGTVIGRAFSAAVVFAMAVMPHASYATQFYVNYETGNDANAGTDSSSPKKTIQAAIDASSSGDFISVASGVYGPISTANKAIEIVGESNFSTIIDGGNSSRCADLGSSLSQNATVMRRFRFYNGLASGSSGGGVRGGTLYDCRIENCSASQGGALAESHAERCDIMYNNAEYDGGAAIQCEIRNSLVVGNTSFSGDLFGGSSNTCVNCTIVGNIAVGGGVASPTSALANCIAWDNDLDEPGFGDGVVAISCFAGADPCFRNPSECDYHLQRNSPCVDAGTNEWVSAISPKDKEGVVRILNGVVDIGCYECTARWPNPQITDCIDPQEVIDVLSDGSVSAKVLKCMGDIATFTGGLSAGLPFDEGICLDTGSRNVFERTSYTDSDLVNVVLQVDSSFSIGGHVSVFEFEAVATSELLSFHYAYASSEFDQGSQFSDPFALLISVNGGEYENLATLDNGMPVSIKNLRAGRNKLQNNSGNSTSGVSSTEYFNYWSLKCNRPYVWDRDVISGFEGGHPVDGITVEFCAEKSVSIGDKVKLKFVIADTGDTFYDSFVFIKADSLGFAEIAGAPIADVATDVSKSGFMCNWYKVTGAVSYRVDVATDPDFKNLLPGCSNAVATENQFRVDGSFPQDSVYYYRVRAVGGNGTVSSDSNVIAVVIPTTEVSAPTISPDSCEFTGSIGVTIVNNHPGATLYYTTDGMNPTVYSSTIASGGHLTLTTDTVVKAMAIYNGVSSPVVSQTYSLPTPVTTPSAVLNVQATDGTQSDGVSVAWSAPASSSAPVLAYEVSRRPTSTATWTVLESYVTTTSYLDSAAEPGADYVYRVRARNVVGWGDYGSDGGWRAVAISLSPASLEFGYAAGSQSVTVTANAGWAIVANAGCASASVADGAITVSVAKNETFSQRTGSVTVTAGASTAHPASATVSVTQGKRPPVLAKLEIVDGATYLEGGESTAFNAIATFDDGTTNVVTTLATWSIVSGEGYGTVGAHTGQLSTYETTDTNGMLTVSATYSSSDYTPVTMSATVNVGIGFTMSLLKPESLAISGDSAISIEETKPYTAVVTYNNGTAEEKTLAEGMTWAVQPGVPSATVKKGPAAAMLSAYAGGISLSLSATYEEKGVSVSGLKSVEVSAPISIPVAVDVEGQGGAKVCDLEFTTLSSDSGNAWYGQADASHDGVDAARSGRVFGEGWSRMETSVTNAGTISFWWKTSCESTYDGLTFAIDGTVMAQTSGTTNGWRRLAFALPSGAHTLRWTYEKDDKNDVGEDCGWVDQVEWEPLQPPSAVSGDVSIGASDGTYSDCVEVEWAPFASSCAILEYELSRRANGDSDWKIVSSNSVAVRFVDAKALPGVDYTYRVRARNNAGWGDYVADAGWRAFELSIDPSELELGYGGAVRPVSVSANADWSTSVVGGGWLTASKDGSLSAMLSASANETMDPRSDTVVFNVGGTTDHALNVELPVVQTGHPPRIDVGFSKFRADWRTRLQIATNGVEYGVYSPVSVFAAGDMLDISFGWTNRSERLVSMPSVRFRIYESYGKECIAEWVEDGRPEEELDVDRGGWSGGWSFDVLRVLKPGDYRLEAEIAPDEDDTFREGDIDGDMNDNIAIFRFAVADPKLTLVGNVFVGDGWSNLETSRGNDFAQEPHAADCEIVNPTNVHVAAAVQFGPYVPMNGVTVTGTKGRKALDLVLLIDDSISMGAGIAGLVKNISVMIDQLLTGDAENEPISDLRIKVVGFYDYKDYDFYSSKNITRPWFREYPFSTDPATLKHELEVLRDGVSGGSANDGESSFDALYYICKGWTQNVFYGKPTGYQDTQYGFRPLDEASRVAVIFTDEPPHVLPYKDKNNRECNVPGCLGADGKGLTMKMVDEALREAGVSLMIVGDGLYQGDMGTYVNGYKYGELVDMDPDTRSLIEPAPENRYTGALAKMTADAGFIRNLAGQVSQQVVTQVSKVEPSLSVNVKGSGNLCFSWCNNSTAGENNTFSFQCDGGMTNLVCEAGTGWHTERIRLEGGSHSLKWSYGKVDYYGAVSDCGLIGDIAWLPDETQLAIYPTFFSIDHPGSRDEESESATVHIGEGDQKVQVTCNTIWTVVTNDVPEWITFVSRDGIGDGEIAFQVATNETHATRTATITVKAGEYGQDDDDIRKKEFRVEQKPSPYVENGEIQIITVGVKPRWPWNQTVDIDFRIVTPEESGTPVKISFTGVNNEGGDMIDYYPALKNAREVSPKSGNLTSKMGIVSGNDTYAVCLTSGLYRVSWNDMSSAWYSTHSSIGSSAGWKQNGFHSPAFSIRLKAECAGKATVELPSDYVRVDSRVTNAKAAYSGGSIISGEEKIGHPDGSVDPEPYNSADKEKFPLAGWNHLNFVEKLPKDYSNDYSRICAINNAYVEGGVIATDTVWRADKVHVVRDNVFVHKDATLTIEDGAVVKFCYNTYMYIYKNPKETGVKEFNIRLKGAYITCGFDDAYGNNTLYYDIGGRTGDTTEKWNGLASLPILSNASSGENLLPQIASSEARAGTRVSLQCKVNGKWVSWKDRFYSRGQHWGNLPRPSEAGKEFFGWYCNDPSTWLTTDILASKYLASKAFMISPLGTPFDTETFGAGTTMDKVTKHFRDGQIFALLCPEGWADSVWAPIDASTGRIVLDRESAIYNGTDQKPDIASLSVYDSLITNTCYEVVYGADDFISAGKYSVGVKFLTPDYANSPSVDFAIEPRPIGKGEIIFSDPTNRVMYLPGLKKPTVTVRLPAFQGSEIADSVATADAEIPDFVALGDHAWPEVGDYMVVASYEGNPNYTGGALTNIFTISVNPDYVFTECTTLEEVEDQLEMFQSKYPGREPRVIRFSGRTNDVVSAYWKDQIRGNTALNDFVATNFVCWVDDTAGSPAMGVRSIDDLDRDIVAADGVLSAAQIFAFLRAALVADKLPVNASSAKLTVVGTAEFEYNGSGHRPDVTVVLGSDPEPLPSDTYELVYSGAGVDVGEYTVRAVFCGAYCGETEEVPFRVVPKALALSDVSLSKSSAEYDGYMHRPSVSSSGIPCSVDFGTGDFAAVGTYPIVVTASGNYTGSVTVYFEVYPHSVTDAVVELDAYAAEVKTAKSGLAVDVRPHVLSVRDFSRLYEPGVDYDIAYSAEEFTTAGVYEVSAEFKGRYSGVAAVQFTVFEAVDVAVSLDGDPDAEIETDAADPSRITVRPSPGNKSVEVVIPDGVDESKVTVEVSTSVTSVKPSGAAVKVVKEVAPGVKYDITDFLDIPAADSSGVVDLSKADVKSEFAAEALDVDKGAEISLNASEPTLTTPATRPGLVYTLWEGSSLKGMKSGASKVGDGKAWSPAISVKGGTSGFYSIKVGK